MENGYAQPNDPSFRGSYTNGNGSNGNGAVHNGNGMHHPPQQQAPPPGYGYGGYGYQGSYSNISAKKIVQEFLATIKRFKWLIATVATSVFLLVALYTVTVDPEFEAYALVKVDVGKAYNKASALDYGTVDGQSLDVQDPSTQAVLLSESPEIAGYMAEQLEKQQFIPGSNERLSILDDVSASWVDRLVGPMKGRTIKEGPASRDDIMVRLQEDYVKVKSEGGAGLIRITGQSPNAQEAALIANLYATRSVDEIQTGASGQIEGSVEFLEIEVAENKKELDDINERLEAAALASGGAVSLEGESQYTASDLANINASLSEAQVEYQSRQATLTSLEAELAKIEPKLATSLASITKQEIEENKIRIGTLTEKLNQIYSVNPEYRTMEPKPTELKELIDERDERSRNGQILADKLVAELTSVGGAGVGEDGLQYVTDLRQRIEGERIAVKAAGARVATLRRSSGSYQNRLANVPTQSLEISKLQQDRSAAEERYRTNQGRLNEAMMSQSSRLEIAKVERPAVVPDVPIGPGDTFNLILGAILGLMLGLAAAVIRSKFDTTLISPDDVEERGVKLLGAIPLMGNRKAAKRGFFSRRSKRRPGAGAAIKDPKRRYGDRHISDTLVSLLEPISVGADSYRRLFENVSFSMGARQVKSVLITSPEAEVGKSTTALNMAITAAQAGKRTLIIDADLYRPALYDRLGMKSSVGLDELVHAEWLDPDALELKDIENLYAVTSKKPLADAVELLQSEKLRSLLQATFDAFDLVIIDTPPVLLTTGARLLARICDVTVLVASAGTTDGEALEYVTNDLREGGANVIGAVLNRFDPSSTVGYKNTYGYRHKNYGGYSGGSASKARLPKATLPA